MNICYSNIENVDQILIRVGLQWTTLGSLGRTAT